MASRRLDPTGAAVIKRKTWTTLGLALNLALVAPFAAAQPAPADVGYHLPAAGILLEGIGYDPQRHVFYVSGVNDGGRIYRGRIGEPTLEVWQPGGVNGRTTARGIDVDVVGCVFVAGGPSGRLWVLSAEGATLASLATPAGTFLNDVAVGADGAAYFTDSNEARIWRVAPGAGGAWQATLWLDAGATIPVVLPGFNLGGIVATPDGRYLLVAQGTTGRLWRIDVASKEITPVDLGGTSLVNADGIVLRGHSLWVVQNFTRQITELALDGHWASARLVGVTPTSPQRTFTTARIAKGRLLIVDSQFGFAPPFAAENRVVVRKLP
jgi:sugar lactone lactonase YvrE